MKQFFCGVVLTAAIVMLMGSTNTQSNETPNGRFQLAASNTYSDVFILNTATGELFRYAFASPRSSATGGEKIFIETFGSPQEPKHSEIKRLDGKEWSTGLAY